MFDVRNAHCITRYNLNYSSSATYKILNDTANDGSMMLPPHVSGTLNEDLNSKCGYVTPPADVTTCPAYNDFLAEAKAGEVNYTTSYCENDTLLFDTSLVATSLRTDYGLNCSYWINASVLGASYMLGMLFGSFVIGLISDRFGRMIALMISVVLVSVSGVIGAFMPNAAGKKFKFTLLRFPFSILAQNYNNC